MRGGGGIRSRRGPRLRLQHAFMPAETLHSKQLGSIKMPIDSTHGIYRGENPVPGKDVHGELDRTPGIRDGQDPNRALTSGSAHIGSFHSYG